MKKNIAVASGGYSSERAISKKSGEVVFNALLETDYACFHIDTSKEKWTVKDAEGHSYLMDKNDFSIEKEGEKITFDCVVNMIHGAPGENGQLAGYLEMLNIPQTSCSSAMAALTFDKRNCLAVANSLGIPSAKRLGLNLGDAIDLNHIVETVGMPCFVKANRAGSSFGVYKVNEKDALNDAIHRAFKEDNELLIETALDGREVTVGIYERNREIVVLPITEIISDNDFFDYAAKYEGKSQEITPADLPKKWETSIKKMAKELYSKMGLTGITRSEFIFVDGVPHLLEVNTVPGMTLQSIVPQQAEAVGISMQELLKDVIETSLAKNMYL